MLCDAEGVAQHSTFEYAHQVGGCTSASNSSAESTSDSCMARYGMPHATTAQTAAGARSSSPTTGAWSVPRSLSATATAALSEALRKRMPLVRAAWLHAAMQEAGTAKRMHSSRASSLDAERTDLVDGTAAAPQSAAGPGAAPASPGVPCNDLRLESVLSTLKAQLRGA